MAFPLKLQVQAIKVANSSNEVEGLGLDPNVDPKTF